MDETAFCETRSRLENWGRWARSGGGEPNGRCGSVEGRYLREKADEERFKREARIPINVNDALLVEKAVLALRGKRIRTLLVARFVAQFRKEDVCRKLKLDWSLFDASLRRCVYEIHQKLEQQRWWEILARRVKRPKSPPATPITQGAPA